MLLGLSGGVDSSVCALLIHKAVGDPLLPRGEAGCDGKGEPAGNAGRDLLHGEPPEHAGYPRLCGTGQAVGVGDGESGSQEDSDHQPLVQGDEDHLHRSQKPSRFDQGDLYGSRTFEERWKPSDLPRGNPFENRKNRGIESRLDQAGDPQPGYDRSVRDQEPPARV